MNEQELYERGAAPSLIERFSIINLHGYRTLDLDSRHAATILIAPNGAGKTTLLNTLDAFLKAQFARLQDLQFSEIRCKVAGENEELVLTRDSVKRLVESSVDNDLSSFARKSDLNIQNVIDFLTYEFESTRSALRISPDNPIYEAAARAHDYSHQEAINYLRKLKDSIYAACPDLIELSARIHGYLSDVEVLYLPTYRRIETPLIKSGVPTRYRRSPRSRFKLPSNIFSGDMQFGLGDISERLSDLNQSILFESNRGYREISASIISELIDGSFAHQQPIDPDLPSKEELALFFSRLREGPQRGPYPQHGLPNIDQILESSSSRTSESDRFLRYFLGKLNKVLQATKGIESPVEEFISSCNKYLSNSEELGQWERSFSPNQLDSKELRLNRKDLQVYAVSLPTGRRIVLDALSSGEKQMISLFAKLYLYPGRKIVLIDEPELSLSLDWQRNILVDVASAPTCSQMIAITHSPFVFDNDLEPFTRSLNISVNPELLDDDIEDNNEEG